MKHNLSPAWALAVLILGVGAVRADVPGPRPQLSVELQFPNLADHPDYDFYLQYGRSPGNPYAGLRLTRVAGADPVHLEGEGSRLTEVYLLAVPRGQALAPPRLDDPDWRQWLQEVPAGTLRAGPLQGEQGRRLEDCDGQRLSFRVAIADRALHVERTGVTRRPGWWFDRNVMIGIGVALSVSLAAAIVWSRQRARRRAAAELTKGGQ